MSGVGGRPTEVLEAGKKLEQELRKSGSGAWGLRPAEVSRSSVRLCGWRTGFRI